MANYGLGCRKALVGTGSAVSLLLYTNGLSSQSSSQEGPPFLSVNAGGHLQRAGDY